MTVKVFCGLATLFLAPYKPQQSLVDITAASFKETGTNQCSTSSSENRPDHCTDVQGKVEGGDSQLQEEGDNIMKSQADH
jgi:hypothetical protein